MKRGHALPNTEYSEQYYNSLELIRLAGMALLSMQRHSWEQGLALQAFYECGDLDMTTRLCIESVNRISADGRPATLGVSDGCVDPCSVGEPLLAVLKSLNNIENKENLPIKDLKDNSVTDSAAAVTDSAAAATDSAAEPADDVMNDSMAEPADDVMNDSTTDSSEVLFLKSGAERLLKWALQDAPRNDDGIVYHLTRGTEFWADSFYMLPPYLAAAGYTELSIRHVDAYWDALYDKQAGLLCHIWDDKKKVMTDPDHWGVGNGWVLMALVRMIGLLDENESTVQRFQSRAAKLIEDILQHRDSEGHFHNILDDPASFEEAGIAAMLSYSIYRGCRQGWLDEDLLETADDLRIYVESKMDAYGFIHDVCGAPTFTKSGIAPEQQAIFMMMENASMML